MTSRNPAVAMLLNDLRDELVSAPRAAVADEHVRMMQLEHQVLAPVPRTSPRPAATRSAETDSVRTRVHARVQREIATRPRRVAAVLASICVLSGSVGLDAASALPRSLQHLGDHITNSIVHTFGVPQAPHSRAAGAPVSETTTTVGTHGNGSQHLAAGRQGAGATAPTTSGVTTTQPSSGEQSSRPTSTTTPATRPGTPGTDPGDGSTGYLPPPKQTMQSNRPPGYPVDWKERAVAVARAQLQSCVQATTLTPVACPQTAAAGGASPAAVHWTLLNPPLAGWAVVATPLETNPVYQAITGYEVSVYGLFQMGASYTAGGDTTHPYAAYSGGVARATMRWNGSAFAKVAYTTGSVGVAYPSGIVAPQFQRPASVDDSSALATVLAGVSACATGASSAADPRVPNCPQNASIDPHATNVQWTLVGNPIDGATVSFDPVHGNFSVTGTYAMTLTYDLAGASVSVPVTGNYTATLSFDGYLRLFTIVGSS